MSRLATLRRFRSDTLQRLADDCARLVDLVMLELHDLRFALEPKLTFSNATTISTDERLVLKVGVIPQVDSTAATVDVFLPSLKPKDAGAHAGVVKVVAANSVRFNATDGSVVNSLSATQTSVTSAGLYLLVWNGRAWWLHA